MNGKSGDMSKVIPMDHGSTQACLGDHFAEFKLVEWSQMNQR